MSIYVPPLMPVSYIPFSHSSDRIKVWTFLSNGGRQHETVKIKTRFFVSMKTWMRKSLPSGLALPPKYLEPCTVYRSGTLADTPDEAYQSWFGPFVKVVFTGGGAPTNPDILQWARRMLFPITHMGLQRLDPESSALSYSDDGWFRTGDVGGGVQAAEVVAVLAIGPTKNGDAFAADNLLPPEIPSRVISTYTAFSIDHRMLTTSCKKARKKSYN
eukprot:gene35140-45489_t